MKFVMLFSALFTISNAFAHSPPPIDVTNASGGASHSGYGYYGNDDYEGFIKLRKQCTEQDQQNNLSVFKAFCQGQGTPMPDLTSEQFQTIAGNMVNHKFIDQVMNNVVDEVKLIDPAYAPSSASCLNPQITGVSGTHRDVRREAMSLKNALSASLLSDIHSGGNSASNYQERLRINYPYLFDPTNRYNELTALMQGALGAAYDNSLKITAHAETMDALNAKLTADPAFKTTLETKLEDIKQGYATSLKRKVEQLCQNDNQLFNARRDNANTIRFLHENFRRDFQQNLIDLNPTDRAMANGYLCKQNFYYDPKKFDSDCDGRDDDDDPAPNDPLNPRSSFNIDEPNMTFNPPFGSHAKYNVALANNAITLTRPVKVKFNGMNAAEKTQALANLARCGQELNTSLQASFDAYKASPEGAAFRSRNLTVEMPITEDSNEDFEVHKCWCSTCTTRYRDATGTVRDIPKSTCREAMTPEMVAGLSDATLNPSARARGWWPQADAANFTLASISGTDCKTIKHELMHKLGLPDEYHSESYYPFNQLGPDASLMNSGDGVYARHIVFLMSPKACERRSENYGI